MNSAALEKRAKLERFIRRLRSELIDLGMPESAVMRLSAHSLVECRASFTERHLLGAPKSAKGA